MSVADVRDFGMLLGGKLQVNNDGERLCLSGIVSPLATYRVFVILDGHRLQLFITLRYVIDLCGSQ